MKKPFRALPRVSVMELHGIPKLRLALPLALQHVIAMIVGCVTPAIVVASVANLGESDRILLIQSSLIVSALSTLLQLFPIFKKTKYLQLGSGLPVIMGVSFAYLATMQGIAEEFSIGTILGAQIVGAMVAIVIGFSITKIRKFFPPLVTGTIIFTIGISLYPTAINYMAGGTSNPQYGSWQNWLVACITLAVVVCLNFFGKGVVKLASILIGMVVGYGISFFFGMVSFDAVTNASLVQLPSVLYFGIHFEPSTCIAMALLFAINAIQGIGDFTATTTGGLHREPTNKELKGAIVGYGVANFFGALLGGLPTATYSQNVGIVITTKVVNRLVLGLAAVLLLLAGLFPPFSALLTTIPQCVLGGATISVFASIAMTGIKLITTEELNYRNTSIVGLAVALGVGVSQASAYLSMFPSWVLTIFGKSPVVIAAILVISLNLLLPSTDTTETINT